MCSNSKIVDLTLSDNDDSDTELLSLEERITRLQKAKENSVKTSVSITPLKRQIDSVSDEDDLKKNKETVSTSLEKKMFSISKEEDNLEKNEDSDEFELPSLADVLGLHHEIKIPDYQKECKQSSRRVPKVPEEINEVYSKQYLGSALGMQFTVKLSDEEDEYEEEVADEPKRVKKAHANSDIALTKDAVRQEKNKLREEKKQEKEFAKALKASEKELLKSRKPEECLKGMKVILDHNLIFEKQSEDIYCALDEANLKYNIEENPINKSVIWCRTILDVTLDNNQVIKEEREVLENVLVLFIPNEDFIKMTFASMQKFKGKSDDASTLLDYIANIKAMFPQMDLTCVIVGLDAYLKFLKENEMTDFQLKNMAKKVSKTVIEEATIEVQLQAFVNFNFLHSMRELGELLARFSKAIAEAPQRREKQQQKCLAFSWYADGDTHCPVKIGRDGSGFMKLWQQHLQQFNNVGPEVAEAIASQYPSPQILIQAYKDSSSTKEAQALLQDIVVRRNYGPLGTQRRIGPELSYKMHLFFTSKDGNQILQR